MTRIGCRAHDYGKLPAAELAAVLHAKGYTGAQLAMPAALQALQILPISPGNSLQRSARRLPRRMWKFRC